MMIFTAPGVTPVTTPPEDIVAIAVLLLDHTPGIELDKVVVRDVHKPEPVAELIVATALTVIFCVATHAPPREYVIVALPGLLPVTLPKPATLATEGALLVQAPPATVLLNDTVLPLHTVEGPLITEGDKLTETVVVTKQPKE